MRKKENGLARYQVILYGLFGTGFNTFYLMFLAYNRLYYLTDVLHLSMSVSAIVNTLSVWGNVVTTMLAGILIDRVDFKTGKYRTWILIGAVTVAGALPALFSNWNVSQSLAGIIFVGLFILQSVAYSCLWVAEKAIIGKLCVGADDANRLAVASQQGSLISGILYGVVSAPLTALFHNNYTLLALLFGLLVLAGGTGLFIITKKYDSGYQTAARVSRKKGSVRMLMRTSRKLIIPFFLAVGFGNCHVSVFNSLAAYYAKYVLEDLWVLGAIVSIGTVFSVLGTWVYQFLFRRFPPVKCVVVSNIITALLYVLIAYWGKSTVPFLILRAAICFVSCSNGIICITFAHEIADYNEMMLGHDDNRAFIQSISGSAIRISTAIASTAVSFVLLRIGYSSDLAPSPKVLQSITNLMAWLPASVSLLSVIALLFYRIDKKRLTDFREEKLLKKETE